jgi:hypothetical protein
MQASEQAFTSSGRTSVATLADSQAWRTPRSVTGPPHTLHEIIESAPHRPGSGPPAGTGPGPTSGNGGRYLKFPKILRVLTVLLLRFLHLVSSYGNQCSRGDVYGSNTSRLAIAPISAGSRTRLLRYSTRHFTAVSRPTAAA